MSALMPGPDGSTEMLRPHSVAEHADDLSRAFWNGWNAETRERSLDRVSLEQMAAAERALDELGHKDLDIIDVGCGAGWMWPVLTSYGSVTGVDLADEVLARAAHRWPEADFVAGDFTKLDLGCDAFDVVVAFEVLSHVADQWALIEKMHRSLREDGVLILATQNRPALERNAVPAPMPGQRRRWFDRHELAELLDPFFEIDEMRSITPKFNRGPLRIVNSFRLRRAGSQIGLSVLFDRVDRMQEARWLGWTLVAIGRRKPD